NRAVALSLVALFTSLLSGCSGTAGINPNTSTITPTTADLLTGGTIQFSTNISTNPSELIWSVTGIVNGNSSVGTIDATGFYTAPSLQPQAPLTVTVVSATHPSTSASAQITVVGSGEVATTANAQVAMYTIAPSVPATVSVEFGTDTSYG